MIGELAGYEALVAVVRAGSVTTAARALGVPRATLSRHLASLEADLGVSLVTRSTRAILPTPAGQRLVERVAPLLEEWRSAVASAREESAEVRGSVRVSVIPLLAPALAPVCAALADDHPELRVEIAANVRLVDLRSEGFDVAIWAGELRDPDLVCRRLTSGHVGLVAAPSYLERHGTPSSAADLVNHRLLRGHNAASQPRAWWPLTDGGRLRVEGAFVTNDHALLRAAALAGQGIALLTDATCERALEDGRLLRVLPREVGQEAVVWAILAERERVPSRVRAFLDALFAHFRLRPEQLEGA